jgi:hypothetical protein
MHRFVVTLIAGGAAVLAAGLASAPATAAPFTAAAVTPQGAATAPGTVTLAGVRYWYGNRYYLPYCGNRPCYRRYNGHRPHYRGHYRYYPYHPRYYGYYPYYAPLTICGTLLCRQPRYFIAPAW